MGEVWANSRYWWQGDGAVQYWERVLELDPTHHGARQALFDYWMNQADNAEYWRDYDAAKRDYEEALAYMPDHPEALSSLGALYLSEDDEEEARRYFQRAMEHAGQDLKPYQLIVSAWLLDLNEDAAWDLMDHIEEKFDDIPLSFYILTGGFCIKMGQQEMARKWFDAALEKAPPEETPLIAIGDLLIQTQAHDLAREYLQQAVDNEQAPGYAHMSLGMLDIIEEDERGARRHWRKANRIARRNRDDELLELVQRTRELLSLPPYLRNLVMSGASLPPDLFEMLDENEEFFNDEFGF
jgi:tetratricopeptide (TPR) repeat protein